MPTNRQLVLAALLLVAFPWASPAAGGAYHASVGVYELLLPPGRHYLALPLVELEPAALPAIFRLGWSAFDAIASYDPEGRQWKTWFPHRRPPLDGDRKLYSRVLRVQVAQPTVVAFCGTLSKDGWRKDLTDALGSNFLGVTSPTAESLQEIVNALEGTGRFNLSRDKLYRWNIGTRTWIAIEPGSLAGQVLQPGSALFTPATIQPNFQLGTSYSQPVGPEAQLSDPNSTVTTNVGVSTGAGSATTFQIFH